MIVRFPYQVMQAYGVDPRALGGIRMFEGALLLKLIDRFGEWEGLVCGKTLKLQRKGVVLFGKKYLFPFDTDDVDEQFRQRRKLPDEESHPPLPEPPNDATHAVV